MSDESKISSSATDSGDISTNLSWIDMLKGIAIIGVFLDNWLGYMEWTATPALIASLIATLRMAVGPFVQVFFILSGFGLTISYLRQSKTNWSWQSWGLRRLVKIVIPYEIFVIISFALGIIGSYLYETVEVQFSWISFLAYVTFTRNFYPPSWVWNPPLWFMPVIIGLYLCFPLLIRILQKWGPWILLLISMLVTCGSLVIAILISTTRTHAADFFTFWILQFALGMILAYMRETNPQRLRLLIGPGPFLAGIGLLICSWALRTYVPLGKVFNDPVTSTGIFLALLNLGWVIRAAVPAIERRLNALSHESYYMYLIHYPIIAFIIGPLLRVPMHPIIVLLSGCIYILAIFLLSYFISKPIDKLISNLFTSRSKEKRVAKAIVQ